LCILLLADPISSYWLDLSVKLSNFCTPLFYFDYQHSDYYCPTNMYVKASRLDLYHQALKKALLVRTFCPLAPYRQRRHHWIKEPLCPYNRHLVCSPFPSVSIPLHIAILKRRLPNKLKIATIIFWFVNVHWPSQPNARHLRPSHLCQLVELVHERVGRPFRITPSRWSSRNWLWIIFVSFHMFLLLSFILASLPLLLVHFLP